MNKDARRAHRLIYYRRVFRV